VVGYIIELLETPKARGTNLSGKSDRGSAQEMVIIQEMTQWAISSEAPKGAQASMGNVQRLSGDGL
jgi:hypothetical protein